MLRTQVLGNTIYSILKQSQTKSSKVELPTTSFYLPAKIIKRDHHLSSNPQGSLSLRKELLPTLALAPTSIRSQIEPLLSQSQYSRINFRRISISVLLRGSLQTLSSRLNRVLACTTIAINGIRGLTTWSSSTFKRSQLRRPQMRQLMAELLVWIKLLKGASNLIKFSQTPQRAIISTPFRDDLS